MPLSKRRVGENLDVVAKVIGLHDRSAFQMREAQQDHRDERDSEKSAASTARPGRQRPAAACFSARSMVVAMVFPPLFRVFGKRSAKDPCLVVTAVSCPSTDLASHDQDRHPAPGKAGFLQYRRPAASQRRADFSASVSTSPAARLAGMPQ